MSPYLVPGGPAVTGTGFKPGSEVDLWLHSTPDVEETEGPEVGFTRPVEGLPNVEYLSAADPGAAEDTLLETLNQVGETR